MLVNNDVEQGSFEWLAARLGLVTASRFGDIVTATGKKAAGQKKYAYQLAAETITGEPIDGYQSLEMFKGKAFEGEAVALYTLLTGHKVRRVGLIYQDKGRRVGGSPDGLIYGGEPLGEYGPVGGVEIKNVLPHTQVEYLDVGGVPLKYRPQVYGSLYISNLEYWDFFSHSPGLAPHRFTVRADDEDYLKYKQRLNEEMPKFITLLDGIIQRTSV